MKFLDKLATNLPFTLRFLLLPAIWRLAVLAGWYLIVTRPLDIEKIPWLNDYAQDLGTVLGTLSGVFGVLAAFVSTSVTVIYASGAQAAEALKNASPRSLPRKLIYSALTLLGLSLLLALFQSNAIAANLKLTALAGALTLATFEVGIVALLTLRAIEGHGGTAEQGRDPD